MSQGETSERSKGDTPLGHSGRAALRREQLNGFDQRVIRQQLCKHATVEEAVFPVDPTDAPIDWLDSDHVIGKLNRLAWSVF
jgi:hypothetical protein